jgi:predicted acyltransferase
MRGTRKTIRGVPDAHRLESLDVLRGLAVAGMIVVNNPGDWSAVFPPLMHAFWTGFTLADLVFPAFIFVTGMAAPFALTRRREAGASTGDLYKYLARRAAVLVALGLALNAVSSWPEPWPLRFPGVLQRIGIAYLIAGVVVLRVRPSRWPMVAAALLLGHWALLALVPFGDQPAGTMTPDHSLAGYIDTLVFGRHALAAPIEPEGLLGTLTASASAILGASAGELIRRQSGKGLVVHALALSGATAVVIGLAWSRVLPISKPLWTGSFVLVTAGIAALVLAPIYFAVDVRGRRGWCRPLVWLGTSPLTIYIGSEVVRRLLDAAVVPQASGRTTPKAWLFWEVLEPAFGSWPEVASLGFSLGVLAVWIAVAAVLYRSQRWTSG